MSDLRLVALKLNSNGSTVWVNPAAVKTVSGHVPTDVDMPDDAVAGATLVSFVGENRATVVEGTPHDVASALVEGRSMAEDRSLP